MQKKTIYLPAKQSFAHSSCVPKAPHWERGEYTIVIVTHNMAQARRASDEAIFMLMGELIEHARTEDLFINPKNSKTADYIEGRYG